MGENAIGRHKNLVVWSGEISFENYVKFRTEVELALAEAVEKKIIIEICSFGGRTCVGVGAYDFLQSLKDRGFIIETIACGGVMSAAVSLFLGGTVRRAYKNTIFLIHSTSGSVNGRVEEESLKNELQSVKFFNAKYKAQVIEACGSKFDKEAYAQLHRTGKEFGASKALELGFVHEII